MIAAFAVLAVLLQNAPQLAAELAEDPTPGRLPPAFVCTGTAKAPDGVILHVQLVLETPAGPQEVDHGLARVRDGKFTRALEPFKGLPRNLPGAWTAHVSYEPTLQALDPPPFTDRAAAEALLRIGSAAEIQKAHQEVRERLLADLRALQAAVLEPAKALEEEKTKPDPARWAPLRAGLEARNKAIRNRGTTDRELRALGLAGIPDQGLDLLMNIIVESVDMAKRGDAVTLQQARERLDREVAKMIVFVTSQGDEPDRARLMVRQMREALASAAALAPEARPGARRRFVEAVLQLGRLAPTEAAAVGELSAAGRAYFDAIEAGKKDAPVLLHELQKGLAELHEKLPK